MFSEVDRERALCMELCAVIDAGIQSSDRGVHQNPLNVFSTKNRVTA